MWEENYKFTGSLFGFDNNTPKHNTTFHSTLLCDKIAMCCCQYNNKNIKLQYATNN